MRSAEQGDTWNHWQYVVIKPDSAKATALFADQRMRNLKLRAQQAASNWNTGSDRANLVKIDAVISAFQAYRAALGVQEGDTDG